MFQHRTLFALGLAAAPALAAATPFLPDFAGASFVPGAAITHAYFSIGAQETKVYVGNTVDEDGDPVVERFELSSLGAGPVILGITTVARRDRAFVDGRLEEDTFDYYAQDTDGNVWYMGEDVTNYVYDDEDRLIGTNSASSWRAGVHDALPGFAMPANLATGFNYYQEFAPADGAIDDATTMAGGLSVSIGLGTFHDVIRVLETNALNPDSREFKYYAPGVGLILVEEGLDANLANPDFALELVSAVPLPPGLPLFGVAVGVLLRRRRPGQPVGQR